MRYAVIMAGGAGTRLWPMSRAGTPKQLIPFIHQGPGRPPLTLLDIAASRMEGLVPEPRRFICTAEAYREQVKARLPAFTDDRILGEPAPRDTLNAVGFAAAVLAASDPDAVFAVLTADHMISPHDRFAHAIDVGFRLVERDPSRLVSFAITPTYPATGFGYIEDGGPIHDQDGETYQGLAFRLARFVEKPPLDKATQYLAAGTFSWNAGLFVFHARTFMDLLSRHQPANHAGLARIAQAWPTPQRDATLREVYPTLPKTSVDYGIMEPAMHDRAVTLCGVRMHVDWLDVGSWPSYGDTLAEDASANRAAGTTLVAHDSTNNITIGDDDAHTIALVGCHNLTIIRTKDATLVMPTDRAQDLKHLHAKLPGSLQ